MGVAAIYISEPVKPTFILSVVQASIRHSYVKLSTSFFLAPRYLTPQLFHSISLLYKCTTLFSKRSEGVQDKIMAGLEYDAMDGLEETGPRVTVREVSLR